MNKKIEEIDKLIHESLSKEEAEFYDQLEEEGLFEKVFGIFKGRMKWVNIIALIFQLVLITLAVICLLEFLDATSVEGLIRWGAGMFGCMLMSSFIKLQQWLQMETNSIKREMKRLEFQVSLLANK